MFYGVRTSKIYRFIRTRGLSIVRIKKLEGLIAILNNNLRKPVSGDRSAYEDDEI